jgi:hypothetical protein
MIEMKHKSFCCRNTEPFFETVIKGNTTYSHDPKEIWNEVSILLGFTIIYILFMHSLEVRIIDILFVVTFY